ncbi:MAG: putative toxin-antitoxin system toxin component, PIN family [Desulfococcaceae bacterium]|jgi:putative PIN family toxin of toxin-antitoxin system|nr:putative toxin-antitoxin system toxin component, PIN family [Desulfococcaceae bacterium]
MKVVLDTNVLVSAFLKPRSKPARILRLILQGNIDIVINEYILAEYYEVLIRPKFDLNSVNIETVLSFIRSTGIYAPALPESFQLPDESDTPFLEAALATYADILITGNIRHFPKAFCKNMPVMTPAEFLGNQIYDIKPLINNSGIGVGDYVYLSDNPLNTSSCTRHIPTLQSRGVTVYHSCP